MCRKTAPIQKTKGCDGGFAFGIPILGDFAEKAARMVLAIEFEAQFDLDR
ncbi:MAG: hypothetical protein JGK33_08865 [Microcoleus sp. PH2017_11_PCY_U_A]|nr:MULTISPECIES: hypothetical protein [unclassified Microcoleus]MCC3459769.1 hypothetical protein [Microcoleus sp. PH2017_11_PCY_U_A]MCC3478202.1 hypothetical protein [Microcoleus sp. PH2017_12_PCY_D_A]